MRRAITCVQSDELRSGLRPFSSLTNYVRDEVLDPGKPHHTHTVWADESEVVVMEDFLDADGCRHYDLREVQP